MPANATKNWRFANFNTSLISRNGVDYSDTGTYTCVGNNGISPSVTYSIKLNVTGL